MRVLSIGCIPSLPCSPFPWTNVSFKLFFVCIDAMGASVRMRVHVRRTVDNDAVFLCSSPSHCFETGCLTEPVAPYLAELLPFRITDMLWGLPTCSGTLAFFMAAGYEHRFSCLRMRALSISPSSYLYPMLFHTPILMYCLYYRHRTCTIHTSYII